MFGNKSLAADMAVDPLLALCAGAAAPAETVARGCAALAGWDRRFEASSKGAALFRALWARLGSRNDLWAVAFDPADPVNTPRDLATEGAKGEKLLLVKHDDSLMIADAGKKLEPEPISLAEVKLRIDPLAEWKQIFGDVWRMEKA